MDEGLRHALSVGMVLLGAAACSAEVSVGNNPDEELNTEVSDFTIRPFDQCTPHGPCPDLSLDPNALRDSVTIETRDIAASSCSVVEGSIVGPHVGETSGTIRRRLLRFTTSVTNIGTGSLFLGDPAKGDIKFFELSPCHGHFHFKGYAAYELKQKDGAVAAHGHKESFCV